MIAKHIKGHLFIVTFQGRQMDVIAKSGFDALLIACQAWGIGYLEGVAA